MAESSSDSDHFRYRNRFSQWATRTVHRDTGSHPVADVTAKVNTITSTLQDTSRNLRQVDEMLGRYRDYNIGQASAIEQLHAFHQSLRDLSSEQVRLGDDFNKELSRRSRSDAETKRALDELTEKLNEAQKQDVVPDRVERRLQEIEREMRTERELVERRQDQLGLMSLKLQEALKKQEAKADENEEAMKTKLRQTETEKSQLEQELELSRRLLSQSEGSRETLLHQVEELRTQLSKAEGDRKGLQHQVPYISKQQSSHQDDQRDDWRFRRGVEREKQNLEKQMAELRVHLNFNAMASELEEVKRCMERKDREKASLAAQIEGSSAERKAGE
ncbi:centrosomal protein of 128 kDa isoform X2 [Sigmodon hispidus]